MLKKKTNANCQSFFRNVNFLLYIYRIATCVQHRYITSQNRSVYICVYVYRRHVPIIHHLDYVFIISSCIGMTFAIKFLNLHRNLVCVIILIILICSSCYCSFYHLKNTNICDAKSRNYLKQ